MVKHVRGFTLVELLVVMVIMGSVLALVGPLTIKQLDNVEKTREQEELSRYIQQTQFNAINFRKAYRIDLAGNDFSMRRVSDGNVVFKQTFDYLTFPQQVVIINQNGFWQQHSIRWLDEDRERSLSLRNHGTTYHE